MKWTSEAGPRQTKAVEKALGALRWKGKEVIEVSGVIGGEERRSRVVRGMVTGEPSEASQVALSEIGERYGWKVTRENARHVVADLERATASLVVPEVDERITAAEQMERQRAQVEQQQRNEAERTQRAEDAERIEADLRERYPWAESAGKLSEQARAAKNLKRELQAAFPGVRFSVRSEGFSMGDAVRVSWTCGPTVDEVKALTGKYERGSFNGMEDIYEYDSSAYGDAVGRVLGRTKYVTEDREYPAGARDEVARLLCEAQGVEFNGHHTRGVFGDHDCEDAGTYAYRMLYVASWPVGAELVGIESAHDDPDNRNSYRLVFSAVEPPKPTGTNGTAPKTGGARVEKHHHTKRGHDFFIVVLSDRVDRDTFEELRSLCKHFGGWYSRKWGSTPGGFAFREESDARAFASQIGGDDEPTPTGTDGAPAAASKGDPAKAERLRGMADKLSATIEGKRNPDRPRNTARQRCNANHAAHEAKSLEWGQRALYALADHVEAGTLPVSLAGLSLTKAAVLPMMAKRHDPHPDSCYDLVSTDEWSDESAAAKALQALTLAHCGVDEAEERRKTYREQVERKAEGLEGQVPGYFPTPPEIASRMVDLAGIEEGMRVLEPSAGGGALLDEIASRVNGSTVVHACEVNYTLREVLEAKGYALVGHDFTDYDVPDEGRYDRIVMNPPFERGQDAEHIARAFSMLKPGGRLVALHSPGLMFRTDRKATAFRELCEEAGGYPEDVPPFPKGQRAMRVVLHK